MLTAEPRSIRLNTRERMKRSVAMRPLRGSAAMRPLRGSSTRPPARRPKPSILSHVIAGTGRMRASNSGRCGGRDGTIESDRSPGALPDRRTLEHVRRRCELLAELAEQRAHTEAASKRS